MTSWRVRLVCFTEFDLERDMELLATNFQYLCYGEETCPSTQRKHYQGFAYSDTAQRFSYYKKIFGNTHFEPCKGNLQQNEKYCSKEGKYHEFGQKPMGDGKKRSLAVFCDRLKEGVDLMTVATEDPVTAAQYGNGLRMVEQAFTYKKLKSIPKEFAPEVIYIYGPARTGKTRYATQGLEFGTDYFDVPMEDKYKWKCGYNGQDTVLFDNLNMDNFDRTRLLKDIDRYPIWAPTKGGKVYWRPRRIFITSVYPPEKLAEIFDEPAELLGRLTRVVKQEEYQASLK